MTAAENYRQWAEKTARLEDWLTKTQADYGALVANLNVTSDPAMRAQIVASAKTLEGRLKDNREALWKAKLWLEEHRADAGRN